MRLLGKLLWALSTSTLAFALSSAPATDWQKTLVGVPQTSSPLSSPVFHRLATRNGKHLVFLLTSTHKNVLAALDPVGSSVAWRHVFEDNDPILAFQARHDGLIALSGAGGVNARLFEVTSGNIIWETRLLRPEESPLDATTAFGTSFAFASDSSPDVFVLVNGYRISRLHGLTGAAKWIWTSPDMSSSVVYFRVVSSRQRIYALGATKSFAGFSLHITVLDEATGAEIVSQPIPSSIEDPTKHLLVLGNANAPSIIWVENGNLKSLVLSPELSSITPETTEGIAEIVDTQSASNGLFIGLKKDRSASIYSTSASSVLQKMWDFADSVQSEDYSESTWGSGYDKEGHPYVSRIYWSNFFKSCSFQLFAPHGAKGRGMISGFNFPFSTLQHGVILHSAIDVANPSETLFATRFAITTSTGSFQVWQQDQPKWVREESLADIRAATFVDLAMPLLKSQNVSPQSDGFLGRLARQQEQLNNLPAYLVSFAKRFVADASQATATPGGDTTTPFGDTFGFRKFIVAATSFGKVMAIDSSTGNVVWGQLLSLSDATGKPLNLEMKMLLAKPVDGLNQRPEVVLAVSSAQPTSIVKPARGPLSSYGKVLANRTTLYKYINPHLMAVVVGPESSVQGEGVETSCDVYLLDVVKGNAIYHAPLGSVAKTCDVKAVLVDNRLVYSYYEDTTGKQDGAKGPRIVSVELYEGYGPDDKTSKSDMTSFSVEGTRITVFQQTFVSPAGIKSIAASSTKYGISLKQIIVATDTDQLYAIPPHLLDPRRPNRKPTAAEQEEGLIPLDSVLSNDGRHTISRTHAVANVKEILTSPSQLESTSMVFAYGLDLFFTRVAPSGTFDLLSEDFNRVQLLFTT
ncbi:hypothetical protein FRB99_001723, partial [Tulasnella sp. 403]